MRDSILLELAARWEREAAPVATSAASQSNERDHGDAIGRGHREAKRECADTIRTLVKMLGEDK